MRYQNLIQGTFLDRPNRFLARVWLEGKETFVHVKNTGRCAELLVPGASVFVQKQESTTRKTAGDLVVVKKGDRLINIDSFAPNMAVKEWLSKKTFFPDLTVLQPEYTYRDSRIDFYLETGEKKILLEVKGVTLEKDGVARFPDAPSERAVKHLKTLTQAVQEGYEAYLLFVVQMKGVRVLTPNTEAQPAFTDALLAASDAGVQVLAYDCQVTENEMTLDQEVPVVLHAPELFALREPLLSWYRTSHRKLPWRGQQDPYRIWVSEIMLQQTRVEAVIPYYERFIRELPTIQVLADAPEDQLLKLWEGLGYYSRVRNMQKAARTMVAQYGGQFPRTFEEIRQLCGIGAYTAGAISSIAFGLPEPAVDGNVLRVVARLTENDADILDPHTKAEVEAAVREVIPREAPGDFNQALMELGATICTPNGAPNCAACPGKDLCRTREKGRTAEIPVRKKAKARRVEEKTILCLKDGDTVAIVKRKETGLLAGLYELPNLEGHQSQREVTRYLKEIGLMPLHIKALPSAKHLFTHVEWRMIGYEIRVDELEKTNEKNFLFVSPEEIQKTYPIPSAFEKYLAYVNS